MKKSLLGSFTITIESGKFSRNTNVVNKMNPFIVIKQTKDKTQKQRLLYRKKKVISRSPVWPKGHKTPVWKCRVKLPDWVGYPPSYVFKAMNKGAIIEEEIGRCIVNLQEIRDIKKLDKVNYSITYAGHTSGTICLSFKYKNYQKNTEAPEPQLTVDEEQKLMDMEFATLPVEFADGEQNYDEYIPTDPNEDKIDEEEHKKLENWPSGSSDEEFLTLAERNRAYHKIPIFFKPKSSEVYVFNQNENQFYEISKQNEVIHPLDLQSTELPDGSYLLTGGRDSLTNDLTQSVVHYLNGQYFVRADFPTPRVEHATSYLKGYVYCIGGYNNDGVLKSIQAHDMNSDTWIDCGDLVNARYRASLWKFEESIIYVFGGCVSFEIDPFTDSIEKFSTESATSQVLSIKLPKPLAGTVCMQRNERSILVFGGSKFSPKKYVHELKLKDKKWKKRDELSEPITSNFAPMVNKNKISFFSCQTDEKGLPKVVEHNFDFHI